MTASATARPKAVLFDAGNTLVFVDAERAIEALARFGVARDVDAFHAAEQRARLGLGRRMAAQGPVSEPDAWREYFGTLLLGLGVSEAERPAAGRAMLADHERDHMWTRVDPTTPPALERLRAEGYRLGVVSNADGRMPDLIAQVGLAGFFEFVVDSHLVGVAKPDPRIFEVAVGRLQLRPEECLYVGDLYAVDVVGARSARLHPVLLDPFGALDLPVARVPKVGDLPQWLEETF